MQFEDGERGEYLTRTSRTSIADLEPSDLVMLQHKFEIEHSNGARETRTSTLCEYGVPYGSGGYSAMARLVGISAAVGTKMVLNGIIKQRGVLAPLSGKINEPLIKELKEKYGISCIEKTIA